jgi:4-hydroxy-tetrahydrodipicolinate synthase
LLSAVFSSFWFIFTENFPMMQLKGTGVALVTPFSHDGSVDYVALEKLIDHVINGGIQYIVSLGTTGETPTLSKEEKKSIITFTISHVKSRVPVVVGIGGNDTAAVIRDLQELPLDNVAAVLSAAPY